MQAKQTDQIHDLLIIGGGINGAGIAADAAGRGLDVVLCEKNDLASATSSWSSKLIHGGLRYLEFFQFSLVRKSLREREILTQSAPHLIKPIPFQIPMTSHSRSALKLRAGLFIYDHLARRKAFSQSRRVRYGDDGPLNASIRQGFEYWDAQVDDSRLVVANALQARVKGAQILTRTECVGIRPDRGGWKVVLQDRSANRVVEKQCRVLVNASGPWVSALEGKLTQRPPTHELRLVKGSHLVVPRLYEHNQAFLLQHQDGRIVFVIPYLDRYSLVGTTEEEFTGDLDAVGISKAEVDYLISLTNSYFRKNLQSSDIVSTFSGVRPLIDDSSDSATKASRDYALELIDDPMPLLSVYGGKVTTYRILAEHVMAELGRFFPRMGAPWTATAALPGGDFESSETLLQELTSQYDWLGTDLSGRLLDSYGTRCFELLRGATNIGDLGVNLGADLYQREVDFLCRQEWARCAEDILWRRSKLGYLFDDQQKNLLESYIRELKFDEGSAID